MPLPQTIPPVSGHPDLPPIPDGFDCEAAERWLIDLAFWYALRVMARFAPFPVQIISGYRTLRQQLELIEQGKGAPDELSTHRSCPATGADIRVGVAVTDEVKKALGQAAMRAGLRWGGGSTVDPRTGIPSDWNHVDMGRRQ